MFQSNAQAVLDERKVDPNGHGTVGAGEGDDDGVNDGSDDGLGDGKDVGATVGRVVGTCEGNADGAGVGFKVGVAVKSVKSANALKLTPQEDTVASLVNFQ